MQVFVACTNYCVCCVSVRGVPGPPRRSPRFSFQMSEEGRTDLIDDSEIKICIKTCTVLLERVYLELLLFIELKIEMFILNL